MELRYYQQDCIDAIFSYFASNTGNPICALPTGTGKSVIIAEFARRALVAYPGTRLMMLTHVKELIDQNFQKLTALWPTAPAGIYSAGLGLRQIRPITFAGIASVAKKAQLFGRVDLVLMDECQMMSHREDTNYGNFFAELKHVNPKLKVIGFSATPYRLGQGKLTDPIIEKDSTRPALFTDICYDITGLAAFNKLIAEGYLCTLIPKRTSKELDVSGVHMVGGDYNLGELQAAVDKSEVTYRVCQEMIELGHDREHWLIFATGVEHSEHVASMLDSLGIAAKAVHSKIAPELRDEYIRDFKSGKLRCLVNNNVLTTGFDAPFIDLIGMLRPTTSPGLWVQMLGRGTRPYPDKQNCLVLDFAGNTRRLGPINDPVTPKRKGRKSGGEAPVKICEACGTYNHASVRHCVCCGAEFIKQVKLATEASANELVVGDVPVVEVFKVDSVDYYKHQPKDAARPPSLKVCYFCGLQMFTEYICLEHDGFASKKARDWWRVRAGIEPGQHAGIPTTVSEAMQRIENLDTPTHIRVWVNKKRPEVMAYDFTNTAFKQARPAVGNSLIAK